MDEPPPYSESVKPSAPYEPPGYSAPAGSYPPHQQPHHMQSQYTPLTGFPIAAAGRPPYGQYPAAYPPAGPPTSAPGYGLPPPLPQHVQQQEVEQQLQQPLKPPLIGFDALTAAVSGPPPPLGVERQRHLGGARSTPVVQYQPMPTGVIIRYRRDPVLTICPKCNHHGLTRVDTSSGCLTWLLCLLLAFFGCFFGCCLVPFCIDSTKDVRHYCTRCRHRIASYAPL